MEKASDHFLAVVVEYFLVELHTLILEKTIDDGSLVHRLFLARPVRMVVQQVDSSDLVLSWIFKTKVIEKFLALDHPPIETPVMLANIKLALLKMLSYSFANPAENALETLI